MPTDTMVRFYRGMATAPNPLTTEFKPLVFGDSKWLDAFHARTATPLSRFHAGMRYYFKIDKPRDYLDLIFVQLREVRLDILKFDDWLQAQHPEHAAQPISTVQIVDQHYGADAVKFVHSFI